MKISQPIQCPNGHIGRIRPNGSCRLCEQAAKRAAIKNDPVRLEAQREYHRNYARNNKNRMNETSTALYKLKNIQIRLRRKGIEPTSEIISYIQNHSGKCDICGNDGDGRWNTLAIDHCHTTNKFRGMLCTECNTGLGKFQDDPIRMEKAIAYLRHYMPVP